MCRCIDIHVCTKSHRALVTSLGQLLCVCINTCVYMHIHIHICIYIYIYAYFNIYICLHIKIYTRTKKYLGCALFQKPPCSFKSVRQLKRYMYIYICRYIYAYVYVLNTTYLAHFFKNHFALFKSVGQLKRAIPRRVLRDIYIYIYIDIYINACIYTYEDIHM